MSKPILDKTRTRSLVRHRSEFESETDDDEGQTVEGREIGLQRVFDLVIGVSFLSRYYLDPGTNGPWSCDFFFFRQRQLTDSYRFGILLPSNDSAFSLSPPVDPSSRHPSASSISTTIFTPSDTLFDLGASIALEILSHPVLDPSQATPPPHNIHQNHPLFNLSSPRQIPTIKAHLLYLLALHSWSSDREGSVKCWEEILGIANAAAGGLGKEGDEIILKSASRLGRGTQGEECKLVKKKVLRGGGNRKMVGSEGVGGRRRTAPSSDAYNTTTRDEVPTSAISIGQECPPSPPTSEEHHSSTSSKKPRALTFHFRPDDGYPSPPASPLLELGDGSTESFSALISSEIDEEPLQPPSKTLRRLASNSSFQPTPPNLDRMFKRAESITYISTLPPDFFSSKSKLSSTFVRFPSEAAAQAVFPSGSSVETPSRDVEAGNPKSSREAVSWTANFRKKLSNFRSTEVISTLFRRKDKEGTSAAVETLQKVLLRDDLSAGPGMYWGDFNELEADVEIESEVGTELETEIEPEEEEEETLPAQNQYGPKFVAIVSFPYSLKRPPPALRSTRSFFDPTTSSPSVAIPRVPKRQVSLVSFDTPPKLITTPPTPDKSPFPSSSKQSSLERSPSKVRGSGNGDLDPYLAELERKSRVGVKTKCSTCGKQGLNFPACPRCMENYCSRSCRTEKGLAGDGERHVCAGKCR